MGDEQEMTTPEVTVPETPASEPATAPTPPEVVAPRDGGQIESQPWDETPVDKIKVVVARALGYKGSEKYLSWIPNLVVEKDGSYRHLPENGREPLR